jgi:hypothetical protein
MMRLSRVRGADVPAVVIAAEEVGDVRNQSATVDGGTLAT